MFAVPLDSTRLWLNSSASKSFDANGFASEHETTPLFFNLGGNLVAENEQGQWRDGLWDCFSLGFFHAILWNAICCPTVLLGQLLTRLDLNMFGGPQSEQHTQQHDNQRMRMRTWSDTSWSESSSVGQANTSPMVQQRSIWRGMHDKPQEINQQSELSPILRSQPAHQRHQPTAFSRIVVLCCCFWVTVIVLCPPLPVLVQDVDTGEILALYISQHISWVRWNVFRLFIVGFCLFTVLLLARLRYIVRRQEKISACLGSSQCCGMVEDVAAATCCTCCVVSQLARQTGGNRQAACCSQTGLIDESIF